ncbi:MAG: shikimate dehydrogenase [Flavobacteriales bacterium]|nr:shikimate dehydrogenase [Flavobacteriales bacterium]
MPDLLKVGLLGSDLGHTQSPDLFRQIFRKAGIRNMDYLVYDMPDLSNVRNLLFDRQLIGFNITIPYKETIIPYLDGLDPMAAEIGAVNTAVRKGHNWIGHNTDVIGFRQTMELLNITDRRPAVVIGTGGSSKAVQFVLNEMGFPILLMSRSKRKETLSFDELSEQRVREFGIVVNTTPLGKSPVAHRAPLFRYEFLKRGQVLIDLNYNPPMNLFLQLGLRMGCRVINGKYMLRKQAEASWKLWKEQIPRN